MEPKILTKNLHAYLKTLKGGIIIGDWAYMGETQEAFGSPGGSWKGQDGFLFNHTEGNNSFILRSVEEKSALVIESVTSRRQLFNFKLTNKNNYSVNDGICLLKEAYVLTLGMQGKVSKDRVKEAFYQAGSKDDKICSLDKGKPDWNILINSFLNWGITREKVKKILVGQNPPDGKINTETLPIKSIYKISMSPRPSEIPASTYDMLLSKNLIAVSQNTKAKVGMPVSQGELFTEKMKIGDHFYLCRGNKQIVLIGKITSDVQECIDGDLARKGFVQRGFEKVSDSVKKGKFNGTQKWWTPNDNSTCIEIPEKDYDLANKELFKPFFNVELVKNGKDVTPKKPSINTILYGPPGTGKTFQLQGKYLDCFVQKNEKIDKQTFEYQEISKLPWWKVIALILFEKGKLSVPEIKTHPYLQHRLRASDTNSLDQTLWGQLSSHTVKESMTVNYSQKIEPLIFDKDSDSVWHIVEEKMGFIGDLFELSKKLNNFKSETIVQKNYQFITFHQSFSYEDFIEGIKPELSEDEKDSTDIRYHIDNGLFYNCCDDAARLAGFVNLRDCIENYTKEDRIKKFENAPPFALFIDEINRGNISSIFGELITLIEKDKRLSKNEIIVTLPYSKRRFGVPPNLYIIGTMNTADRSVEALDTALRRRFSFEFVGPDSGLIPEEIERVKLRELFETINARIRYLLDEDHQIGHSYFMKVKNLRDLKDVFANSLIPLLKEYFYNDYGKIRLVLGDGFVSKTESTKKSVSFAVKDDDFVFDKATFSVNKLTTDEEFIAALENTLKNA